MNETLITKYRPGDFDEIWGHEDIINALQRALKSTVCPHAFLFTGPSGVGKTTIARILGKHINAEILPFDAASHSTKEDALRLAELGQHFALGGAKARLLLIDEIHALSSAAFQSLLLILEEPPAHLYFALCTTELQKVPETILTRCYHVALRALKDREIEELLSAICDAEAWKIDADVLQLIVQSSTGQPRKALSLLQSCHDAPSREEARRIVSLLDDSSALVDLLKVLLSGKKDWSIIQPLLETLPDDFDNSVIAGTRYIIGAMTKQKDSAKALMAWNLLNALTFPTSTFDKKAHFVVSIGRFIFDA